MTENGAIKMQEYYRFADVPFRIGSHYDYVREQCADYRIGEPPDGVAPDCDFQITKEDIDYERAVSAETDRAEGRKPFEYGDDRLESMAVCRKVAEALAGRDTVLFHGSALALDGEVYLFAAPSGTGKSTHARLWREVFGERVVMVNDDKPLIRLLEGRPFVYGTPWNGKHRLGANIRRPLKAICLLRRGDKNKIEPIGFQEAVPALLRQTYQPHDGRKLSESLTTLEKTAQNAALYRLFCNMEKEAAEVAYEGMKETL